MQLVNNSRGTINILINDSAAIRENIDGYIATAYTTKESGQITKKLKPHSRLFSIDDLRFNTTYVVEVSSYKGDVISNRSLPITVRIPNAGKENASDDVSVVNLFHHCCIKFKSIMWHKLLPVK